MAPTTIARGKNRQYEMLVIGTSLGGLNALQTILSGIPATFSLPIVVVQHRHKTSDHVLASALQRTSALPIRDADDKEKVVPGRVFLAPADYHLMVAAGRFVLSVDEPVHFSRPSIDVLFESAADEYDDRVIGLLLTGANRDGASGLRKIKENGGVALVQDPETAEAPAMPRAGIEETNVDRILPLSKIAPFIVRRYGRK